MSISSGLLIRLIIAAVSAVLMGSGSVVAFNRISPRWFEDYDETDETGRQNGTQRRILPPDLVEADNAGRQRLQSTPWKYAFTGYFGIALVYLAVRGGSASFQVAVMCVLFVVLEMAIADRLYKVVPDQFSICLAVLAAGFVGYHDKWWEPLAGAGLGLAISCAVFGLGMVLFRTGSIGGADIKFFTCMGLIVGRTGIVVIYILTTVFFAAEAAVLIATGRGSIRDRNAMLPSACAAVTVYFLFLWNISDMIFSIFL